MDNEFYLRIAIEKVVPLSNQEYIDLFIYAFSPSQTTELTQAVDECDMNMIADIYENQIINKIHEVITENPNIDEGLAKEYFYKILRAMNVMIYMNTSEFPDFKYSIIQLEKERTIEQKRIHGEPPPLVEFEKFLLEKEKIYEHAKTDKSASELLRERLQLIGSQYIFAASVLSKIDTQLRPEFIDDNSSYVANMFLKNEWKNNKPEINWLKKQSSLLYLLFRLNGWKRDIHGGKLSQFISITFTLNGKKLIESNVSKALSKISAESQSSEIDVINDLLNSIQA